MKKIRYIFDLDLTLLDSSHRRSVLPDGTLDLAHWIENNTREKILRDSLLPLAYYAMSVIDAGYEVIACTARVMQEHDHELLESRGLRFARILSRPMGCTDADHVLKENLLRKDAKDCREFFKDYADNSMLFDDARSVLDHLERLGFICFDAAALNRGMDRAA